MKQVNISELMDDYVDNEVFPQGGSAADVEAVRARVLARAAPRRHRPRFAQMLLAAALAVGCVLCMAAAGPLTQLYHMVSGDSMLVQVDPAGQYYLRISWQDETIPIVLEDGRLWLLLGEKRTDVTDLIDEETPYIVKGEDPESGLKSYLIVGGTPEDYGWYVWMEMPLGEYMGGGWNTYAAYYKIDGDLIEYNEWRTALPYSDSEPVPSELVPETVTINKPWYENGNAQLHLWGVPIPFLPET